MKTIYTLLFLIVSLSLSAERYTNTDHLDSIKGYIYTVDYDSVYYKSIDTTYVMPIKVVVRYNQANWRYNAKDLFIWERDMRKHKRRLKSNSCDIYYKYYKVEALKK